MQPAASPLSPVGPAATAGSPQQPMEERLLQQQLRQQARSLAVECAAAGDLQCALFVLRRCRQLGVDIDASCLDAFFGSGGGAVSPSTPPLSPSSYVPIMTSHHSAGASARAPAPSPSSSLSSSFSSESMSPPMAGSPVNSVLPPSPRQQRRAAAAARAGALAAAAAEAAAGEGGDGGDGAFALGGSREAKAKEQAGGWKVYRMKILHHNTIALAAPSTSPVLPSTDTPSPSSSSPLSSSSSSSSSSSLSQRRPSSVFSPIAAHCDEAEHAAPSSPSSSSSSVAARSSLSDSGDVPFTTQLVIDSAAAAAAAAAARVAAAASAAAEEEVAMYTANSMKLTSLRFGLTSRGVGANSSASASAPPPAAAAASAAAAVAAGAASAAEAGLWEHLPSELLQRIVEAAGQQTVLLAAGVCSEWANAIHGTTEYLSFTWCTSKSLNLLLRSVAPKFRHVKGINLRRCYQLDDSGLSAVAAACPRLQSLLLCMSPNVTDQSLSAVARHCPQLQVLDLSGCRGVTEAGLMALSRGCQNLRELNLCGCTTAATNHALFALSRFCGHLRALNLGWCDRVDDAGVVALARGCRGLRALDLCGCTAVTDHAVIALAENCLHVRELGLHCCRRLTDLAMAALAVSSIGRAHLLHSDSDSDSDSDCADADANGVSACTSRHATGRSLSMTTATTMLPAPPALQPAPSHLGVFHTILHHDLPSEPSPTGRSGSSSSPSGAAAAAVPPGLVALNISGCLGLRAAAVQAVCDRFPALHTCTPMRSLNTGGCMALLTVRCRCAAARAAAEAAARAEAEALAALRPTAPRLHPGMRVMF